MKKYTYMIIDNVSMLLIYIQCFNVLDYLSDFACLTWFSLSSSDFSMRHFKLFFFEITGGGVIHKLVIDTFFLSSSSWLVSFMAFATSFMFFTSFESTASCIVFFLKSFNGTLIFCRQPILYCLNGTERFDV